MNNNAFNHRKLIFIVLLAIAPQAYAEIVPERKLYKFPSESYVVDSIARPPKQDDNGKNDNGKGNKNNNIKEVPKARRQQKPATVKPVKVKPVKIVKPKVKLNMGLHR